MKELETLHGYPMTDGYGNCYGIQPPTMGEVVNKINDIIEIVNQLQADVDYLKDQEEKRKVYKVIRRYDVLLQAKQMIIDGEHRGICCAIRESLDRYGLTKYTIEHYFPKLYKAEAIRFGANKFNKYQGYWWKPGRFGILSGRRRYLNWLIKEYKDDSEILNQIELKQNSRI